MHNIEMYQWAGNSNKYIPPDDPYQFEKYLQNHASPEKQIEEISKALYHQSEMPLYQSNVKSDYLRRVQQLMEFPDHTQQDIMYHNHLIQSAVAPTFHDAHSIQNKKTSLVCNSNLVSPLVTIEEPMEDYLGSIEHQVNKPLNGQTLPEHMDDTQKDIKMYSKTVRKCTEKIIGLKQKIEDAKRANNQSELNSLLKLKLSTENDLIYNQRFKAMLNRRYEGLIEYDASHQKKCTIS
jgi:hypothetical protein